MGKKVRKNLSIVIPVANESETLERFYSDIISNISPYEDRLQIKILFIVDNASKDNTRDIVKSFQSKDDRVHLIWAPENKSVVDAYLIGFRTAIADNCDFILEMDGGLTHLPDEIPQFLDKLLEGYDCVFGSRFLNDGEMDAGAKRLMFSKGGTIIANLLLGTKLSDTTSGFEAFRSNVLNNIISKKLVSTGHFFQTEIRFRARHYNFTEVPIHYSNPCNKIPARYIANAFQGLLSCIVERIKGVRYE